MEGVKSSKRQVPFQSGHSFCRTPTSRGREGGPDEEAGTHSPPCQLYPPNMKPRTLQLNGYFTLSCSLTKLQPSPAFCICGPKYNL